MAAQIYYPEYLKYKGIVYRVIQLGSKYYWSFYSMKGKETVRGVGPSLILSRRLARTAIDEHIFKDSAHLHRA